MYPKPSFTEHPDRPFVFINSAMSADGKLSTIERKQIRISGTADFSRVDEMRSECDAVLVGIGTVFSDDPSLTVKSAERKAARKARGLSENPVRIVPASLAEIPPDADIFRKGEGKKIIVVSEAAPADRTDMLNGLPDTEVIVAGDEKVDFRLMARLLKEKGINSLMIEGGATVNFEAVRAGIVDEIFTFVGNIFIGGKTAPTFADGAGFSENECIRLELDSFSRIEDGILLKWRVRYDRERSGMRRLIRAGRSSLSYPFRLHGLSGRYDLSGRNI